MLNITTVGLFALQAAVGGQDPTSTSPADSALVHENGIVPAVVTAVRAESQLRLDGRLDEDVWSHAVPATGFRRSEPSDGEPATERTEVRVVYTDAALYVGARMYNRDPDLVSRLRGRRDSFMQQNDQFLLQIDSYHDHRTAFIFAVTPAGGRNDVLAPNDGMRGMDIGWDPVWEVATQIDSLGWVAEMRIPFSQLRFPDDDRPVWGIQFRRDILHTGEAVDWNWRPASEAGWTSKFGHLVGLEDIPRPGRLEVLPYAVASGRFDQRADPSSPFDDGSVYDRSVGVDLKYGLTSGLTVDATINPDFGQVEADPAVVNLTAFETFFREQRPFFVEGGSIFSFGGLEGLRFFYSRRIGGRPSVSARGAGRFVDTPNASTILGAAKLSGKTESGWAIGLLSAVTQRETAEVSDGAGLPRFATPVEPRTNTTALRVRRDFNSGASYFGIIGSGVFRDLDDDAFARLRDRAFAGGADFLHRFRNRSYALQGWIGGSHIEGSPDAILRAQTSSVRYYQRPDQDYVTLDPDRTSLSGLAGELSFRKESGDWLYGIETSAISPSFEMNDAGFQTIGDLFAVTVDGTRRWTTPTTRFRSGNIRVTGMHRNNFGGLTTQRRIGLNLTGTTHAQRRLTLNTNYELEVQDPRATRGGPRMIRPARFGGRVSVNGDSRNRVTGNMSVNYSADTEGSYSIQLQPGVTGRGEGWFSWSLRPSVRWSRDAAFYVTQRDDPSAVSTFGRRYVFAELDQASIDLTARMDMALTPTMTLQVYAQPFVASGDYDGFGALAEPGTFDFLRYGQEGSRISREDGVYQADADGPGSAEPITFGDPDFRRRSFRSNVVLRWEYSPGSTLFLVWSQDRADRVVDPDFDGVADLGRLFSDPMRNVFLIKASYWLDF